MKLLIFSEVKTKEQTVAVASLAKEIWTKHYLPIIGPEQVSYMLDQYQSADAIRRQINSENYQYYLLQNQGVDIGYIGITETEDNSLFLSKLYIKEAYRGKGFATQAIDFCARLCRKKGLDKIWLTVNKHNSGSIAAYRKMGFATVREQTADIGNGFVMDDFIMEKEVCIGSAIQ